MEARRQKEIQVRLSSDCRICVLVAWPLTTHALALPCSCMSKRRPSVWTLRGPHCEHRYAARQRATRGDRSGLSVPLCGGVQMSMEAAERQELEDLKAEEKKRAEVRHDHYTHHNQPV